jgi:hypothetical protein
MSTHIFHYTALHVSLHRTTDDGFEFQCYDSESESEAPANMKSIARERLQASAQCESPSLLGV